MKLKDIRRETIEATWRYENERSNKMNHPSSLTTVSTCVTILKMAAAIPLRAAVICVWFGLSTVAIRVPAQTPDPTHKPGVTLFQNVRIFDGKNSSLAGPKNVFIRGNKIERISSDPIPT